MDINGLRDAVYNIIAKYFSESDTVIVWSEQRKNVRTSNTFITLRLGEVNRSTHYIRRFDNDEPEDSQPSTAGLRIQLFTHGEERRIVTESGETYNVSVNTAVNDLLDLEHYLTSEYGIQLWDKYDIEMMPDGPAQDASEVLDTSYEYRAFQDYSISFTQTYRGRAGIKKKGWTPTASGGGTSELGKMKVGDIDKNKIGIEEKQE